MKFSVSKKALAAALGRVEKSADNKATMPVLANVKIEAGGEEVYLACTDLYISATEVVPAEVEDPGDCAVSAKMLLERVKAMPDGPVTIESSGGNVTVKSGVTSRKFQLFGMPANTMPEIPRIPAVDPSLVIDAGALAMLLGQTMFAISADATRPHLNSILLSLGGGALRLVATDGHRLVKTESAAEGEAEALIPLQGLAQIVRLATSVEEDAVLGVYLHDGTATVSADGKVTSVKLTNATFPAWQQVVPKGPFTTRAVVPREAFADALKSVSLSASDRTGGVLLRLSSGTLEVTAQSPERGEASDEVPSDHTGKAMSVGFNAKYLLDALGALDCEEVSLELGGELDPGVMRPAGDAGDGWLCVVMPMRI